MKTLVDSEKERIKTLEKQEKEVSKLWESIPEFVQNNTGQDENKFQMLQGANPINSKISDMLSNSKNEILILGSEKDYLKLYHSDTLLDIIEKKTNVRLITGCGEKTKYVFEGLKKQAFRMLNDNIDKKLFS